MTATRERIAFINEYRAWQEYREIEGKDSTLEAYSMYLAEREPIEKLEQITKLATDLGLRRGPEASEFAARVQDILDIEFNGNEIMS